MRMSTLSNTTELERGGAGTGPESLGFLLGLLGKKTRDSSKAQMDTRTRPKFCSSQVGVPVWAFQ